MFKFPSVLRADRNARYAAKASLSPSKPFRPHNPPGGKFQITSTKLQIKSDRIWNLIFLKGYVKEQIFLKNKKYRAVCQDIAGLWSLATGPWSLVSCLWSLVTCHSLLVTFTGYLSLVTRHPASPSGLPTSLKLRRDRSQGMFVTIYDSLITIYCH